jgi:polyhydroxyalkanoate synthesis regulator protein
MSQNAASPIVIRRYGAGRLYDPAGLRYVTLAELRRWRGTGRAFCVIDAASGEDVTSVLLA